MHVKFGWKISNRFRKSVTSPKGGIFFDSHCSSCLSSTTAVCCTVTEVLAFVYKLGSQIWSDFLSIHSRNCTLIIWHRRQLVCQLLRSVSETVIHCSQQHARSTPCTQSAIPIRWNSIMACILDYSSAAITELLGHRTINCKEHEATRQKSSVSKADSPTPDRCCICQSAAHAYCIQNDTLDIQGTAFRDATIVGWPLPATNVDAWFLQSTDRRYAADFHECNLPWRLAPFLWLRSCTVSKAQIFSSVRFVVDFQQH